MPELTPARVRTNTVTVEILPSVPHERWRQARAELALRRHTAHLRFCFRKNPPAYLDSLEEGASKLNLPS